MADNEPIKVTLTDQTLALLGLSKAPYHWPETGKFAFQAAFLQYPYVDDPDKAKHARAIERYEACRRILGSWSDYFVEATCLAAIVRRSHLGRVQFDIIVNGTRLLSLGDRMTPRYERRLKLRKLDFPITTARAKIVGGDFPPDPSVPRGFLVMLDQPVMPWRPR
jgi:hypothetical protein